MIRFGVGAQRQVLSEGVTAEREKCEKAGLTSENTVSRKFTKDGTENWSVEFKTFHSFPTWS